MNYSQIIKNKLTSNIIPIIISIIKFEKQKKNIVKNNCQIKIHTKYRNIPLNVDLSFNNVCCNQFRIFTPHFII